jgi:cobalamin biosynthesis Mg chelatase CobN
MITTRNFHCILHASVCAGVFMFQAHSDKNRVLTLQILANPNETSAFGPLASAALSAAPSASGSAPAVTSASAPASTSASASAASASSTSSTSSASASSTTAASTPATASGSGANDVSGVVRRTEPLDYLLDLRSKILMTEIPPELEQELKISSYVQAFVTQLQVGFIDLHVLASHLLPLEYRNHISLGFF